MSKPIHITVRDVRYTITEIGPNRYEVSKPLGEFFNINGGAVQAVSSDGSTSIQTILEIASAHLKK